MKVPAELSAAMLTFTGELHAWLDAGGDKRLLEFKPLDAWMKVTSLMAADGNDFVCDCPDCLAKRQAH